jgi:hypothetical protein
MTYERFRRAARRDPNIRRSIFDYHSHEGNFSGTFVNFEREFQQGSSVEYLFSTYYADNMESAERAVPQINTPGISRGNRDSLMDNRYFKSTIFTLGAGLTCWGIGNYGIEDPENFFRKVIEQAAPAAIAIGAIGSTISGISHFLTRR